MVAAASTQTQITTPVASVVAASKTASADIRSCYLNSGTCDETFTLTASLVNGSALPSWITFDATNRRITVDPLTSAAIGVWNIKVTQNPVSGFDSVQTTAKPAFESVRLTVNCSVTAFLNPAAPSLAARTYNIYSPTKSIDLTPTFALQTPLCDYTPNMVYTWTIGGAPIPADSPIKVNANKSTQIDIVSILKSKVATYSVTFSNAITNSHGGVSSATTSVTFDVIILDPCNVAVITPPTIASTFTVVNG